MFKVRKNVEEKLWILPVYPYIDDSQKIQSIVRTLVGFYKRLRNTKNKNRPSLIGIYSVVDIIKPWLCKQL